MGQGRIQVPWKQKTQNLRGTGMVSRPEEKGVHWKGRKEKSRQSGAVSQYGQKINKLLSRRAMREPGSKSCAGSSHLLDSVSVSARPALCLALRSREVLPFSFPPAAFPGHPGS